MSRPDDSPSVFDASALRQFAAPVDLVQRRLRALADGGWDINSLFLVATDVQQLADRAAEGQLVDLGHRLYQLHGDLERILTSGDVPDRDQSDALMRHVAGLNDYTSAGVETPEFRNTVTTRRLKAVQLPEPEIDVSGLPSIGNIPHFVVPPPEFLPDDGPLDLTMRSEPEEAPSEPQLQAEDDAPDPWAAAPDVNDEPEEDLAAELDMITQAVAFDEDASHSSDEEIEALFAELDVDVAELDLDDDDSGDLTSLFEEIESDTVGAASPAPQEERAEAMLAEIDALDLGPGEEISIYVLHGGDGTTAELTGALDRTFEVQSFTDPEDFLEILGAIGPDAVIMDDAHLDRIDDVAPIVRKLRSKTHGQLPLIVFSTQRDVKVRLKLMRAGVDAFVPADLAIDQALERVRDHLQVAPADPYRVLIAEDDRSQAVFAESILKRAGMEARIEMDPFAVVTALETFHPDLILMDLHMPGCDGMELTAIIRENEAFIHTPIVFLSGEEDQDLQFDALLAGGDDFLAKPVRPKHLISAVKNRVKRSRNTLTATPEAAAPPPDPVATPEPEPEP
ncbi:MAG: response regulator, partial [Pseudomonadota bacterium]